MKTLLLFVISTFSSAALAAGPMCAELKPGMADIPCLTTETANRACSEYSKLQKMNFVPLVSRGRLNCVVYESFSAMLSNDQKTQLQGKSVYLKSDVGAQRPDNCISPAFPMSFGEFGSLLFCVG